MIGFNGGLLGVRKVPTTGSASGLWVPNEQSVAKRADIWPSTPATDPDFANVGHLLHMNGANGSTTYINSSASGLNVGVTGVAQSTAQFKFGSASTLFSGGFYHNLTVPTGASSLYSFGSGDWTVELWLYLETHTGVRRQVTQWVNGGGAAPGIAVTASNTVGIVDAGGTQVAGSTVPSLNTWHHIALTRASGTHRVFLNGVQEGGTFFNNSAYTNAVMLVGLNTDGGAGLGTTGNNAYVDELRITANVARYTANFTPPTAAFPDA